MTNIFNFWRRTPPALFPCLLGFLGLGLSWRRAASVWGIPTWIGEVLALCATVLFALTFLCYLLKMIARPSVVMDDLKVVPARGAVSAGSMCLMMIAALLVPYSIEVARIIWWISLFLHTLYMICVVWAFAQAKNILRNITPPIFLPFIGYIVAAVSGPALGYKDLSAFILLATMPAFLLIAVMSLMNLAKGYVPAPLHPSYAIVLAPTCIYGAGAYEVWSLDVYAWFWWAAMLVAIGMLPFIKWFTKGGWNPGWGGFTFPLSAYAGMMLMGVEAGLGMLSEIAAIGSLGVATVIIPYIVCKTYRLWVIGGLAQATGAACV
ncbi:hypothetical protein F9L33_02460 [Amylibacter sp. SFDW26]|uniref:SLAC1 family transporter n=1 Tax=Amylibacter sp. SFDW26 TaxID=2652722 RepID=UPI001261E2A2|nr:hypothetical protein [Amylibacter sp. SFDW26]KAB7615643.1 hypothetical protein F9L33_02460 [Amylibacter sp. SFDW26]